MFFLFHLVRILAKFISLRTMVTWGSKLMNTGLIYNVEPQSEPTVYLTIDDFPPKNATLGHKVLDILEENDTHVCFFVVQYNLKEDPLNKELFDRVLNKGHDLGNHYDIDLPATDLTDELFVQYLIGTENWIKRFDPGFGYRLPKFFRPPSGKSNQRMVDQLHKHNYINLLGDIYSFDGDYDDEWEHHANMIVNSVENGSIIILHSPEINKRKKTLKILRNIIPRIKDKGFNFGRLSDYYRNKNKDQKK